jgi:hypothetical protein
MWVRQPTKGTTVAFVHGFFSSGEACWKHENGAYWPNLLQKDPELVDLGIYVYTYQTSILSGTYSLNDVVDDLKLHLKLDNLTDSPRIVFVCHSMGGIVVRKLLVKHAVELIGQNVEIGLFLVASPSLGSNYANWFSRIATFMGHKQADVLTFGKSNVWLDELDKDFWNLKESGRLNITGQELIEDKFIVFRGFWRKQVVEGFSGARYFGEPYKVPKSNHFSITKPEDSNAVQHRLLCQFIKRIHPGPEEIPPKVANFGDQSSLWQLSPVAVEQLHYDVALLGVLRQLTNKLQGCINRVELLANLKQVHHVLHKIRQFGIRRWREEVLTQWTEAELSGDAKICYLRGLKEVEKRSALEGFRSKNPNHDDSLKEHIRKVLETEFEDDLSDRRRFEKMANLFAARVQYAFTNTNAAMLAHANDLRSFHLDYSGTLRRKDEDWLTDHRKALEEGHNVLQSVIARHDQWQRMHDQLERTDNAKGSTLFADELDSVLDQLVAIDALLAHATEVARHASHPENVAAKIEMVKRHSETLAKDRNQDKYEGMRKAFDDLFYAVDLETLAAVGASEKDARQEYEAFETKLREVQARLANGSAHQTTERSTTGVAP